MVPTPFVIGLLLTAASQAFSQSTLFFDIRHYGAAGNGTALDTAAFRKAIDAASAAGGGTVFVPARTYLTGTIRLRDSIALRLDSGATLLGGRKTCRTMSRPTEPTNGTRP